MKTVFLLRWLAMFRWGSMSTDHLNESDISGFLDREMSPDERSRVERHLEDCTRCRGAVVQVNRIASTYGRSAERGSISPHPVRRKIAWIPLGAGAALAASLTVMWLSGSQSAPEAGPNPVRAAGSSAPDARPTLQLRTPDEDALVTRGAVTFGWQAAGADVYRLVVQDETGEPVMTRETPDTLVVLRDERALLPGRLYFWRVDAITDGVSASSAVRKFRVAQ